MGCAGSVDSSNKYKQHDDALKSFGKKAGINPTLHTSIGPDLIDKWSKAGGEEHMHHPPPMTLRDEMELQHLAAEFGRDAKGNVMHNYFVCSVQDICRDDGSEEKKLFSRLTEMEESSDMASDGRATPEPGTFSTAVNRKITIMKATSSCEKHEIDFEELKWIHQPCSSAVRRKCLSWDGIYSVGSQRHSPVLEHASDRSSTTHNSVKKASSPSGRYSTTPRQSTYSTTTGGSSSRGFGAPLPQTPTDGSFCSQRSAPDGEAMDHPFTVSCD